ncbi:hypothetical protein AXG93_1335s1220 [Marchantia polymorpha subsp. ruderalis]|uniref:Uncharacterized protein n=1 Tax=Marchantia polymorpha subsp. ruderalis TaxID=1480154 RepID=A0A176W688_MARPO|nr:hypothetical protein AXG93_1335s1220 [Marchantia polymorpha subsp. ruderalis]
MAEGDVTLTRRVMLTGATKGSGSVVEEWHLALWPRACEFYLAFLGAIYKRNCAQSKVEEEEEQQQQQQHQLRTGTDRGAAACRRASLGGDAHALHHDPLRCRSFTLTHPRPRRRSFGGATSSI